MFKYVVSSGNETIFYSPYEPHSITKEYFDEGLDDRYWIRSAETVAEVLDDEDIWENNLSRAEKLRFLARSMKLAEKMENMPGKQFPHGNRR